MEAILAHLQDNAVFYIIGAVVAIPIIYLTRPYSISILQWIVELSIYGVVLHVITYGLVRLVNWFNYETQMKMIADQRVEQGWSSPLYAFWKPELYNPGWILYVEIGLLLVAFGLMLKFRPMKTQKRFTRKPATRGGYTSRSKPPGSGSTAGRGGRYR